MCIYLCDYALSVALNLPTAVITIMENKNYRRLYEHASVDERQAQVTHLFIPLTSAQCAI